jgi:aminoglycoside/choline kinase family phosphotransferase
MIELNNQLANNFLIENGLKNCSFKKVAGDASFRSYYRVFDNDKNFILMYAPKPYENNEPFIKIANLLRNNQLNSPKILAIDLENGFLLLQDFGDNTFSKYLIQNPSCELEIYQTAIDCLLKIHKIDCKNLDIKKYNIAILYREVALFIDWYLPYKQQKISLSEISFFKSSWINLFDKLSKQDGVLVLRDYHADNLMILNHQENSCNVGLLDFQDALIGSFAYDLVSLLEDARRDIDDKNFKKIFDYFVSKSNYNEQDLNIDFEIFSLQRNIKILGIFARLFLRDNKKQYLNFIPRVENFVKKRIANTQLINQDFKNFLLKYL